MRPKLLLEHFGSILKILLRILKCPKNDLIILLNYIEF